MSNLRANPVGQYFLIILGTIITTVGVHYFKFPNNFCFGGVTGIAVIIGKLTTWSPTVATLIINTALLLLGFVVLGREFGLKTVISSLALSLCLWLMEKIHPMSAPLTNQPVLEFVLAIFLPSLGSAILFNVEASGGGTDILAMIYKKFSGASIGNALLLVDFFITLVAFTVFDIQTGLFAFTGLVTKTFIINGAIESFNLSKYFTIICDNPEPICQYINDVMHRGATVSPAEGAFTHHKKAVIFTVLRRSQAIQLRNFIKAIEPHAFIMITNSSEIIGKGFQR